MVDSPAGQGTDKQMAGLGEATHYCIRGYRREIILFLGSLAGATRLEKGREILTATPTTTMQIVSISMTPCATNTMKIIHRGPGLNCFW